MNIRKGMIRLWVVGSVLWAGLIGLLVWPNLGHFPATQVDAPAAENDHRTIGEELLDEVYGQGVERVEERPSTSELALVDIGLVAGLALVPVGIAWAILLVGFWVAKGFWSSPR